MLIQIYSLLSFIFIAAISLTAQDILPAEHKKVKKGQLSYDHTVYTMRDGYNIPSMRVPSKEIYSVKSPAAAFLIAAQNQLENAKEAYQKQTVIKQLNEIAYNIKQVKELDWYWEDKYLQLEYDFYYSYEKKRYEQELNDAQKNENYYKKLEQKRLDSLNNLFAAENYKADSTERQRKLYLESKKDSIRKAQQTAGYHFVNAKSIDLRAAPHANAPLIVNVRACSYIKKLSQPDANGYVFVEVSDYNGYVLNGLLVDNLNKVSVKGADVKFAKENHFVSIYVPVGSTYDPLRQQGAVPEAIHPEEYQNNPNALSELVAKMERENKLVKENKPMPETKTITQIEHKIVVTDKTFLPKAADIPNTKIAKSENKPLIVLTEADKTESKKSKNKEGSSKRKQCTVLLPDGSQCINITTSNSCRCYLHDH